MSKRSAIVISIFVLLMSLSFILGYSTGRKSGVILTSNNIAAGNIYIIEECTKNQIKNCYSTWLKRGMIDSLILHLNHYSKWSLGMLEILDSVSYVDQYETNIKDISNYISENPVNIDCRDFPLTNCKDDISRVKIFINNQE